MDPSTQHMSHEQLLADMTWLSRLAHRLVQDPATADDAVQEAWLAATRRLAASQAGGGEVTGSPTGSPAGQPSRGLMARTLKGIVLHARRGAQRRSFHETRASRLEGLPSTAEILEAGEAQQRLWTHVAALDEPFRSTLILRFQRSLTTRELAEALGMSDDSVRWRVRRGLQLLRDSVERDTDRGGLLGLFPAALVVLHPTPAAAVAVAAKTTGTLGPLAGALVMLKTAGIVAGIAAAAVAMVTWVSARTEPLRATEVQVVERSGTLETPEDLPIVAPSDDDRQRGGASGRGPGPGSRSVAALGAATGAAAVDATTSVVTGRVVDGLGRPVADARITASVRLAWERESTSRADGKFEIECPLDDRRTVSLTVHASRVLAGASLRLGHASGCDFGSLDVPRLDVGDVVQPQGASVVGTVVGEDGLPVEGAIVSQSQTQARTTSGAAGAFVLRGVTKAGSEIDFRAPGVLDRSVPLRVVLGKVIDLGEVRLARGPIIRGRVVDAEGDPVPTAMVELGEGDYPVAADGTFEIRGDDPVQNYLQASAEGYRESVGVRVDVGEDVEFVLHQVGQTCRFAVVDSKTRQPIAGAFVRLEERERDGTPLMGSRSSRAARLADGTQRVTDSSGRIELEGLPRIDGIIVRADGYVERKAFVRKRSMDGGVQRISLRAVRSGNVVGRIPGAALTGGRATVRIEELEQIVARESTSFPGASARILREWKRPLSTTTNDASESGLREWLGSEPTLRVAASHLVHADATGAFEYRCGVPSAVRAVVELPDGAMLVTEVAVVQDGGTVDVGSFQRVTTGSIEARLHVPAELAPEVYLRLNDRKVGDRRADAPRTVVFEGLLPGRYHLAGSKLPDFLSWTDFDRSVLVREGARTVVDFTPEVPTLGRVEFTLSHNGRPVTSEFRVRLRREGDRFSAEYESSSGATKPILVPTGPDYSVEFSLYDSIGSNMDCVLPQTIEIESGEQRMALSIETSRVMCAMPLGWKPPEVAHWQGLRWKDASGTEQRAIDAKDPRVSEAVPNEATGRYEIDFELVPITARDLRMTIHDGDDGVISSHPFEVKLVAGGYAAVTVD